MGNAKQTTPVKSTPSKPVKPTDREIERLNQELRSAQWTTGFSY